MKKVLLTLLFITAFACTAYAQVGSIVSQSSASFQTSGFSTNGNQLYARDALMTIYPSSGSNQFSAACSGVPTPGLEYNYCNIQVKFWQSTQTETAAKLLYVSPGQINFAIPDGWTHTNAWVRVYGPNNTKTHEQFYYTYSAALQTFVAYRYDGTSDTHPGYGGQFVPYPNASVYGWNGTDYVAFRNVVDTTCTNPNNWLTDCLPPTPVPKTYGGRATVIAYYVTGSKHITSAELFFNNVSYGSHTRYDLDPDLYHMEQINWEIPSGMTTGTLLDGKFNHSGLVTPNVWKIKFQ